MLCLFAIMFFILIYFYKNNNTQYKNDRPIHNIDDYPEMKYVYKNRKIIQNEFMKNIINSDNWSNWMEYDKVSNTPIFTHMSRDKIIKRMFDNKCSLDNGKPSWKLFGLILFGREIKENTDKCIETMKILNRCSGIVNAGFSCLEPNVITALHCDFNHDILRCHIPIYIPEGDTAIKINDNLKKWNDNEFFIFDDTYNHQAWNYTNEKRIVLIIDIKKLK